MTPRPDPLATLRQEHEAFLDRLGMFTLTLDQLAPSAESLARAGAVVTFLTAGLPRHERKELDCLLPALTEPPGAASLEAMAARDRLMWDALLELRDAWDRVRQATTPDFPAARETLANAARALYERLREHVYEEEALLFGLVGELLDGDKRTRLVAAMAELDAERLDRLAS